MRVLALPVALVVLLAGCASPVEESRPEDVLATAYPVGYLAERLVGDNLSVGVLVPAGVEPHDWEPTTRDLARLDAARVVVAQGAGFDAWVEDLVRNLGDAAPRLVVATQGLDLHAAEAHEEAHDAGEHDESAHEGDAHEGEDGHDHGPVDPHTWLDPVTYEAQSEVVARSLRSVYPELDREIKARQQALAADLRALHAEYEAGLADCEVPFVIASHDAYGYMAERYGFEVVAVSGLSPEAEPDPETLARVVDLAREHNVTVVFFEELVDPSVVEVIAEEVGATTRVLSPVEGLTPEQRAAGVDYLGLMRENLEALRAGMRCA